MMIVMMPATRQVAVVVAEMASPGSFGPGVERMFGFTKMMYDITTKVVRPAKISVLAFVPASASLNDRSRNASIPLDFAV